jgi:nicotinate-nucleotide pyrophosphorylase (carboxylating)
MFIPRKILEAKLLTILAEDIGQGDITTALIVPEKSMAQAEIIAKEKGVAAGMEEAKILLDCLQLGSKFPVTDGENIRPKQILTKISGDTRTILSVERTLLNVITRMSGIATTTRKLAEKLQRAKLKTKVASTRKTAPGLLYFDKKAVEIGGGDAHRLHLDDMILIKDNHIAVAGSIEKAIKTAKKKASFSKKIEVEVSHVNDVLTAAKANVDIIMLDNFSPKQINQAIALLKKAQYSGRILLEASGGIKSENLIAYASTGVDIVSLSEITTSSKPLNMSLEIVKVF